MKNTAELPAHFETVEANCANAFSNSIIPIVPSIERLSTKRA
jgi:hypothetical protein